MKDSDLSLTDLEHKHSMEFTQDSAKAQSANKSVNVIAEFSGEYAVSKRMWPDHSVNLINLCDTYYVWGTLERKCM